MPNEALPPANEKAQREELAKVLRDPVLFSKGILKHDVWAIPQRILAALAKPRARVAVRACHASSKTFTAAEAVIWFMTMYEDAIVVTTAPTWSQVKDLLWKEIHGAKSRSLIAYPDMNTTDWHWTEERYAVGLSTTEAERFQGFHSGHMLIIIDEAPGVRPAIWEAIDGIRAGGDVRILALGNPTIATGPFFSAFGANRSGWAIFTIDAFDTPNLQSVPGKRWEDKVSQLISWEQANDPELFNDPKPYLTTRSWVLERYREWGPDSPLWTARVRGNFPRQSSTSLIALGWAEMMRYVDPRAGLRVLGVDVARFGNDSTAFARLKGNEIMELRKEQKRDTVWTFREILKYYQDDPMLTIVIDDSGVGGGVTDMCRDADIPVIAFNGANTPQYMEEAQNWLAESYWNLSLALKDGSISMPEERIPLHIQDQLIEMLVGIEYKINNRNKVQVYKKGTKEDRPSPDLADALNMAWVAHRIEINNPSLTSVSIEPGRGSGGPQLAAEKAGSFWRGFGEGFGGTSAALSGGSRRLNAVLQQSVPLPLTGVTSMLCPQCGVIGNLRELGRVGTVRNYEFKCGGCGYKNLHQGPA